MRQFPICIFKWKYIWVIAWERAVACAKVSHSWGRKECVRAGKTFPSPPSLLSVPTLHSLFIEKSEGCWRQGSRRTTFSLVKKHLLSSCPSKPTSGAATMQAPLQSAFKVSRTNVLLKWWNGNQLCQLSVKLAISLYKLYSLTALKSS